jgi:hypothetical protein
MTSQTVEDKHSPNFRKKEALDIIRLAHEHSKVCEPFRKALALDLEEIK